MNGLMKIQQDKIRKLPKIHIRQQFKIFRRIILLILLLATGLVILIATGFMDDEVSGVGSVAGIREYELKTQVTAKTVAVFRRSGDFVRAGEKLVEMDSRDQQDKIREIENRIEDLKLSISVEQKQLEILKKDPLPVHYRHAELGLKEAEERFRRSQVDLEAYTKLYESKAISKHEYLQLEMKHISDKMNMERLREDARTVRTGLAGDIVSKAERELRQMEQQLVSLQDRLETEKRRLEDYILRAPDAGIVTDIPPRPGNYHTAGETIVRFAANQNKKVIALVSENQISKVKPGQKARIICNQYNYLDYGCFYGEVQYVYELPEEIGGQKYYPVKLILTSEPYPLKFGSSCKITIITGRERILFVLLGIKSQDYLERKALNRMRKKMEESHLK